MNTKKLETLTDDQLLEALARYEEHPPTGWDAILRELMLDELAERTEIAA